MRKQTDLQPSLFVGHGSPDLLISDIPARKFFSEVGSHFSRPRGIVVISAHWITYGLQMTGPLAQETIHDFYGFQSRLYEIQYPATGAQWLHDRVFSVLARSGYSASIGSRSGLDHGAWVPLSLMYPDADIPIIQLSLLSDALPEDHFRVGQALEGLRQEGVLILGSGGLVHNLRQLKKEGTPPEIWARSFDKWVFNRIKSRALQELLNFSLEVEHVDLAHPTDEHLMPLFVSMGAGWSDGYSQRIHHSFSYGNLSMSAYAFAAPDMTKKIAVGKDGGQ